MKPDLKEDAWQLILKGKILAATLMDRFEVLITVHSCLQYAPFSTKIKWKKDQHKISSLHVKKSCIFKPFWYGY